MAVLQLQLIKMVDLEEEVQMEATMEEQESLDREIMEVMTEMEILVLAVVVLGVLVEML